jgi:hypothetical protein
MSTLAAQRGRSADDVIEAVTASALRLQQGAARDDIAVLAIRCLGPGERASTPAPA